MKRTSLAAALLSCAWPAAQAVEPDEVAACARVTDEAARLACYDRIAFRLADQLSDQPDSPLAVQLQAEPPAEPPSASFADPAHDAARTTSALQARWELTADTDRGTFGLRPHRQNYVIYKVTDRPNNRPFQPLIARTSTPDLELDSNEVKFQFSFKTKLLSNVFATGSNIWLGYTQQSNWQVFNGDISRPFRETNYEPEVMWVGPLNGSLGGLKLRYASFGYVHQSNGRSEPLSRSWDRVFAEVGAEYGDLALWFRPWWRIPESREKDDNRDIEDYVGRGELVGVYRHGRHLYSLKLRSTFRNSRGSVHADWSFPLAGHLRGYVRLFSGYGESLIDYNWRQTSVGLGVILTDRL
ncbi:phospholipase A [Pseudothauera rhizosphaerae]|nr:phospholipase A [Pseudothauera rhizosphaerae]